MNCGSDKAQEISTIRGKTVLIIKINTNSTLMEAWLSSARGREQDPLSAEPPQSVQEVCSQVEPPCPSLDTPENPSRKAMAAAT